MCVNEPIHPLGTKDIASSRTETTHLLRHEDINGEGRLFGGRLMEWIDDAAGIAAIRHCGGRVTTASVDTLQFKSPAFLNDIVVIVAQVTYVGRTSLEVKVDSYVEDAATGNHKDINRAFFTEVHVDDAGRPAVVPYGLELKTDEERAEADRALFRQEMRRARAESGV